MISRLQRRLGVLFAAACLLGCGGKSQAEGAAASAGGGGGGDSGAPAGGTGSAEGGGTSAGGQQSGAGGLGVKPPPETSCPSDRPTIGSACRYLDQCNYPIDMCSSDGFMCMNGIWTPAPHFDGAAPTCSSLGPGAIPKDGDSCLCGGTLNCLIDDCSGQGKVTAACDNTSWHVTTEPCADSPCGSAGLLCKPTEACVSVATDSLMGDTFACKPDPCAEQLLPTSCDCASSLCKGPDLLCVGAKPGAVMCSCPTC